ncbi:MAG: hypothetical protein BZY81_02260 [SAR202 cluster bacterium Io17-Chloro-G4]|nr:MAG: hypothetical protein BZY81_02260 [SAR202 cluster bacterium Io17-Chloro-G4]
MPVYEHRGQMMSVPDIDTEYTGYFDAAKEGRLVVKKCQDCGLLRGEPGPACPWCPSQKWEWQDVSGKGTIYSYQIVAHTVIPGFKDWAPFAIVLVELDEQSGEPGPGDGLRITANLVDGNMDAEKEENVAIGARVEVVFQKGEGDFAIPQFKLSGEEPRGPLWSHVA